VGAHLLEKPHGGRGVLIGGCTGVRPARVVVLGGGTVGWNAARLAAAMDAEVLLLDHSPQRLRTLESDRRGRMTGLVSSRTLIERLVPSADLLIGAVLTPGGRAPTLVDEDLVRRMKPGSVIVDVAIDQGGCIATSRETTHTDPVVTIHGVQHYAVGNMPGGCPLHLHRSPDECHAPLHRRHCRPRPAGSRHRAARTALRAQHRGWCGLPSRRRQGPGGAHPPPDGLPALNPLCVP